MRPLQRGERREAGKVQGSERSEIQLIERHRRRRRRQEATPAHLATPVGTRLLHSEEHTADWSAKGGR